MMLIARAVIAIVLLGVFIAAFVVMVILSRRRQQQTPQPDFTQFSVAPNFVCLNFPTIPTVTVNYTIDPDGWNNPNTLDVVLTAEVGGNSTWLHPSPVHQSFADSLPTSGSLIFNVEDFFDNIGLTPVTFTVKATLKPAISGADYATREQVVQVFANCSEPGLVEG